MANPKNLRTADAGQSATETAKGALAEGTAAEAEGATATTENPGTDPAAKPKKPSKKGQPVQLGNRRRLGLALRGLLAELAAGTLRATDGDQAGSPAFIEANAALEANKYTTLKPQAELMTEVKELLNKAIAEGNGKLIAAYGKAINRIKVGQPVDLAAIGRQPDALKAANEESAKKAAEGEAATA